LAEPIRILGIDPGSRITGFGLVESDGSATRYLFSGCIRVTGTDFGDKLNEIFSGVRVLVAEYEPHHVAVEKVFLHRNADSALKLGQARAAAICGTLDGGVKLYEYAARAVKQAVVGRGGADKTQVQHMVRAIFSLAELPQSDEADALAVAICHAHTHNFATAHGVSGSGVRPAKESRRKSRSSWRKFAG
jgi:crossover junction endodeoxyribonuclease RuvC